MKVSCTRIFFRNSIKNDFLTDEALRLCEIDYLRVRLKEAAVKNGKLAKVIYYDADTDVFDAPSIAYVPIEMLKKIGVSVVD